MALSGSIHSSWLVFLAIVVFIWTRNTQAFIIKHHPFSVQSHQTHHHQNGGYRSRISSSHPLYAATITGTRTRPRRRDITIETPPQTEEPEDDIETGGGGKRWVRVWPIGLGKYGSDTAVFLARKREVEAGIRLEALPIPLFAKGDIEMIQAAFQNRGSSSRSMAKAALLWVGRHLVVKDNGLFDNLPWNWVAPDTKKEAYNALMGKDVGLASTAYTSTSPYGLLLDLLTQLLRAQVLDLIIDEEDSTRGPGITFGPLIFLQEEGGTNRSKIVDCLFDEVVGLSLAMERAIAMPEDLFEGTVVPTYSLKYVGNVLQLQADKAIDQAEKAIDQEGRMRDLMQIMDDVKPAWEIKNVAKFRAMDGQAKRLCLIKSGAENIPKRRKGQQELDFALLPYLDETVRREARIALAVEAEDWAMVEKLQKEKSQRSKVKDQLIMALQAGDMQLAADLEEKYERLTLARLDPTQDEGAYQKDLDVDDWYLKSRRL